MNHSHPRLDRCFASAILCALLYANGCSRTQSQAASRNHEAPSSKTRWVPVRSLSEGSTEEYAARVIPGPGTLGVVVVPLPARVLTVLAKPGDAVLRGAPIARVVMPDADAAMAALRAADTSLVVLQKRRAQLATLEKEGLTRASDVAALELDIAKFTGEKLRAQATLSAAGLHAGGATLLSSPADGVVTEVTAVQGELRRPEDGALARIRGNSGVRIESVFATMPVANAVYTFSSLADAAIVLSFVNATAQPPSQGNGFVAWFDAPPTTALHAVEGRIMVRLGEGTDRFVVPKSALGTAGTKRFVVARLTEDAAPTQVAVEVVRATTSDVVIHGALANEALVATDPNATKTAETAP